jgi:hypothetical protein
MKLYYERELGLWQLPGQQTKRAERVDIPTDTQGLCIFLNDRQTPLEPPKLEVASDLTPEAQERLFRSPGHIVRSPAAPSYAAQSVQLDDDFDRLPLARQLDLAARAMENARAAL